MFCSKLLFLIISLQFIPKETDESAVFEELFEEGVDAYLDNDFSKCVQNFEGAIEEYKSYTKKLQKCRLHCAKEALHSEPLYPIDVNDLRFFEKSVRNTLCIVKCRRKEPELSNVAGVPQDTEQKFENRKPYEYLHLCYFQEKEYQKAANAAFTYLLSNPDDDVVRKTLKYYSTMPEIDMSAVVNYEAKDYVYLYVRGSHAYEQKKWKDVIELMEDSLFSYLNSEDECRAQCEGPFDHEGWYPDFIPAIASHFTYVLTCKLRCKNKLNSLNGEKVGDLLASHYHYLQYAYFKENDYKGACEAVASYLLFHGDDMMKANMEYYLTLPEVEDYFFTPRPEAANYIQRQHYEEKLFKFIKQEFSPDKINKL